MSNAFNNEYQELNRIKTSMKNTARGLQLNANTLQTLIMRIENIASSNATKPTKPTTITFIAKELFENTTHRPSEQNVSQSQRDNFGQGVACAH
jgi:hypothetical protein